MLRGRATSRLALIFSITCLICISSGCSIPSLTSYSPNQEDRDLFDPGTEDVAGKVIKTEQPLMEYLKKRGMDLLDTFSFRISAGPGIRAHARVTKYLQLGLGYMGPAEGKTMGHTFPVYKLGYLKREGGLWKERTVEMGISIFYDYQTEGELLKGNKHHFSEEDRGFWDIGCAGHWLLIGGEAEIRPDEILDFIGGFFGIDLMDDDGDPPDLDLLSNQEK